MSGAKGPFPSDPSGFPAPATVPTSRDASAALAPFGLEVGSLIAGKYKVRAVLGSGGMGVVVLADHSMLRQPVAIKLLRPELSREPTHVERFLREALAAAQLKSQHVVRVLDADRLPDGAPYLVMESLEGQDLGKVLAGYGPMRTPDVIYFVLQACEALAEAHARGIVHRDLKPSNLFLSQSPEGLPCVKVLDFGISKLDSSDGDLRLTGTSMVLGSPLHMSPEQIRDSRSVDRRSDIWALGTLTFELLAGRPPFLAENAGALIAKISADSPEPLFRYRPDIPHELAAVLARCLEKERERRIQTVEELVQCLAPFAPPEAHVHIDRVLRLAHGSSRPARADQFQATPPPGGSTDHPSGGFSNASLDRSGVSGGHAQGTAAISVVGWGTTRGPALNARRRRGEAAAVVISASTLFLVLIGGIGWWWLRSDEPPSTPHPSVSGALAGGVSAAEPPRLAPSPEKEKQASNPPEVTPSVSSLPAPPVPPVISSPAPGPTQAKNPPVLSGGARSPEALSSARPAPKKPAAEKTARPRASTNPSMFETRN